MDKRIVGTNAGKVWLALKEIGEISIPGLARENKICIQRKNGLLALSDENSFPFNFG